MQVLMNEGIDRRRRFIATVACALGIGVIINPGWATDNLWVETPTMSSGVRAVRYCLAPSLHWGAPYNVLWRMLVRYCFPW